MAARRCSRCVWLLLVFIFSFFTVVRSEEPTHSNDQYASEVDNPQIAAETVKQPSEERRWEATQVDEAVPDDNDDNAAGAAHKQDFPVPDSILTPTPQLEDDFQEELVIRPLHSGDIYASFQFRTLWDKDFTRGSKGKPVNICLRWLQGLTSCACSIRSWILLVDVTLKFCVPCDKYNIYNNIYNIIFHKKFFFLFCSSFFYI